MSDQGEDDAEIPTIVGEYRAPRRIDICYHDQADHVKVLSTSLGDRLIESKAHDSRGFDLREVRN